MDIKNIIEKWHPNIIGKPYKIIEIFKVSDYQLYQDGTKMI